MFATSEKMLDYIDRVIKVSTGKIEGIPAGDPAFTIFKGVPYAKSPVGNLRWAPAEEPDRWEGIRKCDAFSPISIQDEQMVGSFYQKEFFPDRVPMSEDCLYLNIWTPDTTGTKKLPILFWIHGGAFQAGFGWEKEFDGEAICRRNCILVTINYRLGALGFLAHPELTKRSPMHISGNYAITDCIQALKWVKKNAASFGGDPDCITIFGQSAGGAMVQSLITCPPAEGLFKRAIVQSAGGINTLGGNTTLKDMEDIGAKVSEHLGVTIDELMSMPAEKIFTDVRSAIFSSIGFGLFMAPNIDGYYQPMGAGAAIAAKKHFDIDYMTGSVAGDGMLFGGRPISTIEEYEDSLVKTYGSLADEYKKVFDVKSPEDLKELNKARAVAGSKLSPRGWAFAELKNDRKPMHVYYFNREMPGDNAGAYHSSELWYLFGTIDRCWRSMADGFCPGDYQLSRAMTDYWTNFARSGDPNGPSVPHWPAFTDNAPITMILNEKEIAANDMSGDRILDGMVALQLKQAFGD